MKEKEWEGVFWPCISITKLYERLWGVDESGSPNTAILTVDQGNLKKVRGNMISWSGSEEQ